MIGAVLLLFILYIFTVPALSVIKQKHKFVDQRLLISLFWYHIVFWLVYYFYTIFNPSDSKRYYERSSTLQDWLANYQTGTGFIDFVAHPFSGMAGFSYEMTMLLFGWLGYWGFVFFYIFFRENVRYQHSLRGINLISLLMFLPNMHFWTASLGKGSVIFLGLGLTTYGLSRMNIRKIPCVIGLAIIYHVRPHVFLFMCVGTVIGFLTGSKKIAVYQKLLILIGGIVAMFLLYDKVLSAVGIDSENVVESFDAMATSRSTELAKAGSGLDTSNYPLPLKLFTFWFRPLFIDAPGALGLIVSFENLIYVVLAYKLVDKSFISYLAKSDALVKACVVVFIASSIALSTTLSNLGIIIRQKSMVMYFFFFLILSFIDYKKHEKVLKEKKRKARLQQLEAAP